MSHSLDVVVPESGERFLVDRDTGEQISLADTPRVVQILDNIRQYQHHLNSVVAHLEEAITEEMDRQGKFTLRYGHLQAESSSRDAAVKYSYDTEVLRDGLREAGLPEERIEELILKTYTERVSRTDINRLRKAKAEYAEVVDRAESILPKRRRVDVKAVKVRE